MFGLKCSQFRGTKRMTEVSGAYDGGAVGAMTGIVEGTRIATATGWRSVEAIDAGDEVLTFDAGMQRVTKVSRLGLWEGQAPCPRHFWPLEVPAGALGNRDVIRLLPRQSVMVESDAAEEAYGDPFSLLPAEALEGVNGVHRTPPAQKMLIVLLHFEDEQVVFASNGALFFCPSSRDLLTEAEERRSAPTYTVLPLREARQLAMSIEEEALAGETMETQKHSDCIAALAAHAMPARPMMAT